MLWKKPTGATKRINEPQGGKLEVAGQKMPLISIFPSDTS